ncbi:MAG: hypothetical protein SGPRY_000319 [Prymnesium sp.]
MQQQLMDMAVAQSLLTIESALDAEIDKMDNMKEDDLASIRANRISAMKREAAEKQANINNGHGTLTQITDQKEFFDAAKKSNKMIVVFTRLSNNHGKQLLEHMTRLVRAIRKSLLFFTIDPPTAITMFNAHFNPFRFNPREPRSLE